jgi:hypothetical protein
MEIVDAIGVLLPKFRRCVHFILQETEPRTNATMRIRFPEDANPPKRLVFELRYNLQTVSFTIGILSSENEKLLGTMEYPLVPKEETTCELGSQWVKIGEVGTNTASFLIVDPADVIEGAQREFPPYEEVVRLKQSDRVSVAVKRGPEYRRMGDDYLALQIIDAEFRQPSAMVATTGSDGTYDIYARIVKSFGYEHIAEIKLVMDEPSWLRSDLSQEDVDEALDRDKSKGRAIEH